MDGWWYPAGVTIRTLIMGYNEPIYGYDGLSPDQIVAVFKLSCSSSVTTATPPNGKMGPLTAQRSHRYQRESSSAITSVN